MPLLGGVGDGAGLELPGLHGQFGGVRVNLQNLAGLYAVGREIVLSRLGGSRKLWRCWARRR